MNQHNLKNTYDIVRNELLAVRDNVEFVENFVETTMSNIEYEMDNPRAEHIATGLVLYDNGLTNIHTLIEVLRKFNINIELLKLQAQSCKGASDLAVIALSSIATETQVPSSVNLPNKSLLKIKERFTYKKFDLSKFQVNVQYNGYITYISDKDNLLFNTCESQSVAIDGVVRMQQLLQSTSTTTLKNYMTHPSEGEIFGLYIDDNLFRAVRENIFIPSNSPRVMFKALLLDYGEIVDVCGLENVYHIPEDYKYFCAQFFPCKLKSINRRTDINLINYLDEHLFERITFEVVQSHDFVLHLNIIDETIPRKVKSLNPFSSSFSSDADEPVPNLSKSEASALQGIADLKLSLDSNNYLSAQSEFSDTNDNNCVQPLSLKGFLELNTLNGSSSSDEKQKMYSEISSSSDNDLQSNVDGSYGLSDEQKRILYEEPLNTTNAMKAVMGYNPKDDSRICRFYDSSTGGCFKGNNCKLEHVAKIDDGWTRDTCLAIMSIPNVIVLPPVGTYQKIIPTHIISTEIFYCHIIDIRNSSALRMLGLESNSAEEVVKMQTFSEDMPPRDHELVFAQYKDNQWYRAKIFVHYADIGDFKVFYLDYGNFEVLPLSRLRKWNHKYDYLPFQAVLSRLAGIKEIRENRRRGIEFLRHEILNHEIKINVINNAEELLVHCPALAEVIVSNKLANKVPIPPPNKNYSKLPA